MIRRQPDEHAGRQELVSHHRALIRCGLVGLLWLACGCAATTPRDWVRNGFKVGPNYGRPDAPVAENWIGAEDPNLQNRHLEDWWQVFDDPRLNSLVENAFAANLSLRALGMRVLQARAQQSIAAGSIFPQTQQAVGQYSRVNLSRDAFNNPSAIGALSPVPIPPGALLGNNFSDWRSGFNLSWELDFWGRFRRNIESANASLDASVEDYDDGLVTLLADTARNYVRYRVAQQRIEIARENVKIQEGLVALADERFRVGTATRLDVEQAKTLLEQTRSTIPAFQIEQGVANDTLCILLGTPPRDLQMELGPAPPSDYSPLPTVPTWVAAGIPADLLRRRPDVRSAERRVAAQSAKIGVAVADLYPAISINGELGYQAADLSKLFESSSFFGTVTPGFRWNILNYGRIVNNVRLQQARTQELIAEYQNQVLVAARESQSSLRAFARSREQAGDVARSVQAARAAVQVGVDQYKTGTVPFNTVYNLQLTQVQQQDQLAVVQGNIALSLIDAYRALGGGWEVRLPRDTAGQMAPTRLPAVNSLPPQPAGPEMLPTPPPPPMTN